MSKLKLDQMRKDAKNYGWEIISDTYVNLNTAMEFKCSNGHIVSAPYKDIRYKFVCEECEKRPYIPVESKILFSKPKDTYRTLAIDQATMVTGFAIFDNKSLIKYGRASVSEHKSQPERIAYMKKWLIDLIRTIHPDLIVFEDIQLQNFSNGRSTFNKSEENEIGIMTFKTLAELLGVLKNVAFEFGVEFKVIPSKTWKSVVGVTGASRPDQKKSAQIRVLTFYSISVSQDEADAICIGKCATNDIK